MYSSKLRQGYIEEYLQQDDEGLMMAYLSINVEVKTGKEFLSQELKALIKQFRRQNRVTLGLNKYAEMTKYKRLSITDDMVSINDDKEMNTVADCLLSELRGTDVIVDFYVDSRKIEPFRRILEKVYEAKRLNIQYMNWVVNDRSWIIDFSYKYAACRLRLYRDGNGVIVFSDYQNKYLTFYFLLSALQTEIISMAEEKCRNILKTRVDTWIVDDRCFGYSMRLIYGVESVYPEEYRKITKNHSIDNIEYGNNEKDFPILKLLFETPEIRENWMNYKGRA